ncbi:MAG: hypothetical protein ABI593_00235 [Betaproteobacteria bacterium]
MRIELAEVAPLDWQMQCRPRDGNARAGRFCTDPRVDLAVRAEVRKGPCSGRAAPSPLGSKIRPLSEVIDYLPMGAESQHMQALRRLAIEIRVLC